MAKAKNQIRAKSSSEVADEAEGWIAAGPYCILDCAAEVVAKFAGVDKAANRAFVLTACRSHALLVQNIQMVIDALNEAQGEWVAVTETYAPVWTHPLKQAADTLGDTLAFVRELEGAERREVARG